MATTDSKPYEGKHRDNSRKAWIRSMDRDWNALHGLRDGFYFGKHRAEERAA